MRNDVSCCADELRLNVVHVQWPCPRDDRTWRQGASPKILRGAIAGDPRTPALAPSQSSPSTSSPEHTTQPTPPLTVAGPSRFAPVSPPKWHQQATTTVAALLQHRRCRSSALALDFSVNHSGSDGDTVSQRHRLHSARGAWRWQGCAHSKHTRAPPGRELETRYFAPGRLPARVYSTTFVIHGSSRCSSSLPLPPPSLSHGTRQTPARTRGGRYFIYRPPLG